MLSRRCIGLRNVILRNFSQEKSLVGVAVDSNTGIGTVTLQRPPVNSLNLELITQLNTTLHDLEKDRSRGILLKSSSDNVFSAGLDILEMYKPKEERLKLFWTSLQDLWITLYGYNAPTVACINGHAPAGGCLLSLSCEYRVMVNKKSIGLNETKLGIVAPPWFIASLENVIGRRQTELALTAGKMFTSEEALQVGLVDEVVETTDEAISKSMAFLKQFQKISPLARGKTKYFIRENTIRSLVEKRKEDLDLFCGIILQDKIQKGLELYLQSLRKDK